MNIDLGKLTDGQLRELEKKIEFEKETRKNGFLYKHQLGIDAKKYNKERQLLNAHVKKKGSDFDVYKLHTSPMSKIESNVFGIVDYILGNFKIRKRDNGSDTLMLNGSLVQVDNNDEYIQLFNELYSVIDKWVDKKFDDYGLEEEIQG